MSVQVEKLEKNTVKLTIEVPAEELEKALQEAYNRQKKISACRDSVKEKFRELWLRKCTVQAYSTKTQQTH